MIFDRSIYQPSAWGISYHQSTADETLGGGSAGPGKSLTLLWDPICTQVVVEQARMTGQFLDQLPPWLSELCVKYPIKSGMSEGHALFMRRTMPQLRETIDRSLRMFPRFDPGAVYSREFHRWTFSCGYKYTFGHCREEGDYEDYLSQQYTILLLDESSQFTLRQYEELDSRVRSGDPVLRLLLRTRLMSNPSPGWLKARFVDPAPEGRTLLSYKITDPATGKSKTRTRLFLPAKLDDNPDEAFVADYRFRLLSKPAHIRARYLYGDWSSAEGAFFEEDYNPLVHIVEPYKIPRDWPKFRAMDWGYKAPGVIGWFAINPEDDALCQFYEFNFRMMKDEEVARRTMEIEQRFGFWDDRKRRSRLTGVADTQLWEERGDSGKSKASVFSAAGLPWQGADKASIARNAERIAARLLDYDEERPPGLTLFKGCKKTAEMLAGIAVGKNDSTIPDKKSPLKHWFDMLGYACARASRGAKSIPMTAHPFDVRDEDEEEALPAHGAFGYGA